ncbi:hypothetical protein BU17DRAFT_87725 [Hysterangium stoloniferum]|nr:hypothetical protein BU17DRAFT_87724 [Hysterangium stoloniferum]KAF8521800.1 hypothetical protein BU17DRAFT_87725 [Hysterangium stoloniferum]
MSLNETPRLFAFIVGIDNYKHGEKLRLGPTGAIIDATTFKDYLEVVYRPEVVFLSDRQATRTAIMRALSGIQNNKSIQSGDPILIYFAGHGARESPQDDKQSTDWQLLLPYDVDEGKTGRYTGAIYHHDLRDILGQLVGKKGNNITVILDACFSHGGAKGSKELVWPPQPPAVDPESHTYIWIAACGRTETAGGDVKSGGIFTREFMVILRNNDIRTITYRELSTLLPASNPNQNYHIVGSHQGRLLFSLEKVDPSWIPAYKVAEGYKISAGEVNGINLASSFKLLSVGNNEFGPTFTVTKVEHAKTVIRLTSDSGDLPGRARVQQSSSLAEGERFKVYFCDRFKNNFAKSIERNSERRIKITTIEDANIHVDIEDTGSNPLVVFRLKFSLRSHCVDEKIISTASLNHADEILQILLCAAHFHWHLSRLGTSDPPLPISVEFFRVKQDSNNRCHHIRIDQNENLVDKDTTIDIPLGRTNHKYGMQLKNKSESGLYPYLYHFDLVNLNICDYNLSPNGPAGLDFPLGPFSTLDIGYGPSTAHPFDFMARGGATIQNGFFKLVASNRPLTTPFTATSPFVRKEQRAPRQKRTLPSVWRSLLIRTVEHYGT